MTLATGADWGTQESHTGHDGKGEGDDKEKGDDGDHGQAKRQGPVNGGFEASPDFTGWQTIGNDTIQAADFYPPPEGAVQAVLSNGPVPNTPASASALESFLGLRSGALSSPGAAAVNGSAIKQGVVGKEGDVLTFKADFLTNEAAVGGNPDYGFVTLTGANGKTQLIKISGVLTPTSPAVANSTGFARETGYQTYSITLPHSGAFTVGFGVVNVGDANATSDLLVDNVQLTPH
jgi:hypothetical protein